MNTTSDSIVSWQVDFVLVVVFVLIIVHFIRAQVLDKKQSYMLHNIVKFTIVAISFQIYNLLLLITVFISRFLLRHALVGGKYITFLIYCVHYDGNIGKKQMHLVLDDRYSWP